MPKETLAARAGKPVHKDVAGGGGGGRGNQPCSIQTGLQAAWKMLHALPHVKMLRAPSADRATRFAVAAPKGAHSRTPRIAW